MSCVSVGERVCVLLLTFTFKDMSLEKRITTLGKLQAKLEQQKRIERGLKEEKKKKDVCQLKGFEPMTSCFCGLIAV